MLHVRLEYLGDGYVEVADSLEVQRYFFRDDGAIEKSVGGGAVAIREFDGLA